MPLFTSATNRPGQSETGLKTAPETGPEKSQTAPSPLLCLRDLHFSYPNQGLEQELGQESNQRYESARIVANASRGGLANINLNISTGEKVALVGANGSGKSTLLLLSCGCLKPSKGAVLLAGQDCTGKPELARHSLGKLFQDPDNQLFMPTVREELLFSLVHSAYNKDAEQELNASLEAFNLRHLAGRAPHHLSVGEKKRVALAALLLGRPKLLLLDEPTAGLDPRSRRQLNRQLQELNVGFLLATHDLDMVLDVADRVIVLDFGKIVGESPVPGLLKQADFLEEHGLELPLSIQNSR